MRLCQGFTREGSVAQEGVERGVELREVDTPGHIGKERVEDMLGGTMFSCEGESPLMSNR